LELPGFRQQDVDVSHCGNWLAATELAESQGYCVLRLSRQSGKF
jgi:hypothetical protein